MSRPHRLPEAQPWPWPPRREGWRESNALSTLHLDVYEDEASFPLSRTLLRYLGMRNGSGKWQQMTLKSELCQLPSPCFDFCSPEIHCLPGSWNDPTCQVPSPPALFEHFSFSSFSTLHFLLLKITGLPGAWVSCASQSLCLDHSFPTLAELAAAYYLWVNSEVPSTVGTS